MRSKNKFYTRIFKTLAILLVTVAAALPGTAWNDTPVYAATPEAQTRIAAKVNDIPSSAWYLNELSDLMMGGGINGIKDDYANSNDIGCSQLA